MILVVVSLSAVIFAFASNGFSSWESGLSTLFGNSSNSLSERIVVEQVTFNESGSNLGANLYVRNVGQGVSTISAIYLTNATSNTFVLSYQISPAKQILAGSFKIITVTFTPDKGSTYSFSIATQLGNTVLVRETA